MKEEELRKALEKIEPEQEAGERMYRNIKRKASRRTKTSALPRRAYVLPAAACLCVLLAGVLWLGGREPSEKQGGVQLASPILEVSGAKEFEPLGIRMDAPENSTAVRYEIIAGEIACIGFVWEEHSYILRASASAEDFSGLYGTVQEQETLSEEKKAELCRIDLGTSTCYRVSWVDGDVAYFLSNLDGADRESMLTLYREISEQKGER